MGVLGQARRIHFIGVGGIGMSGIAELLVNLGYDVSGSDLQRTDITDRLETLGVRVARGHDAKHVSDAEVVVYSSAVRPANAEMTAARDRGLAVLARADVLADLMRLRDGIAVAGAHGKTTTTSMIALVLEGAGLDPTALIGGRVASFGSNAKLGRGRYLVAEADESDRSFLKLTPHIAVITNVDREHLEAYRGFDELKGAFVQFGNSVPANGVVVICADDPHLRELRGLFTRRVVTYGLDAGADVSATDIEPAGFGSACTVRATEHRTRITVGRLRLSVPGRHNVLNALAAIAVARELSVPFPAAAAALGAFHGAERRFQKRGEANGVVVVEDYGHHPTEIAAVTAAARPLAAGRLIVAFQPHRFSRTQALLSDFGAAFGGVDTLFLTGIYAAGEDPIEGVTVERLAAAIAREFPGELHVIPSLADVPPALARSAAAGDLIVLLGAGSIGSIAPQVLDALAAEGKRQ